MPKLIANTANMPHEEWLELRKQGIGGSDAAAVAGVSKYANPVTVYMEKLNLYSRNTKDNVREAAEWGNRLEPIVRDTFKEKISAERAEKGLEPLKVIHRKAIYAHDEHDFIRTNLDGIIYDPHLGKGIFEAKTAHYMLRDDWDGEDVPNQYLLQVQHNMLVMGVQFAYLAVLIGGNTYKHYFIERDEDICNSLLKIETNFWNNHVLSRIPPEMTGHDAEKEMMKELHPQSELAEGYIVALPNVCIGYVEYIEALKDIMSELDQEKTRVENEVKSIMATTELAYAGPHKVTWKTASNGVRSFKIKLDADNDKEKFYATKRKEVEQERKELEKRLKEIEKEKKAVEKAATKVRKEAEKAAKEALKKAKAELKAADKGVDVCLDSIFIEELQKQIDTKKAEMGWN